MPPEVWNRLGTRVLPKLHAGDDLTVGVEFSVKVDAQLAESLEADLRRVLTELALADQVQIKRS